MLVEATEMSVRLRLRIKELGRIANPGERFEVSSLRYRVLSGENRYNAVFARKVEEEPEKDIFERDDVEPFEATEELQTEPEVEEESTKKKARKSSKKKEDE